LPPLIAGLGCKVKGDRALFPPSGSYLRAEIVYSPGWDRAKALSHHPFWRKGADKTKVALFAYRLADAISMPQ